MVNSKKYRGNYDKKQVVEVSSLKNVMKDELDKILLDFEASLNDVKDLMDNAGQGEFDTYIKADYCPYFPLEIQQQRAKAIIAHVDEKLIDLRDQLKKCRSLFAVTLFPKNEIEQKNRNALSMLSSIIDQISKEVK